MAQAAIEPEAIDDSPLMEAFVEGDIPFEILDGLPVEISSMGIYAAKIATRIATRLNVAAEASGAGEAIVEGLFRLPLAEDRSRARKPDVAFVTADRWPRERPMPLRDNALAVVPDLAVEVLSPTDPIEDVLAKVDEYFRGGVRLVWLVSPTLSRVIVFEGPTSLRVLTVAETLDAGEIVPGFRLPLATLFDPVPSPPTATEDDERAD